MNKDKLATQDPEITANDCISVMDAEKRGISHERMFAALTMTFKFMCEELGLDVSEELGRVAKVEKDALALNIGSVRAVRSYIQEEF
jgi:hypothetical protein